MILGSETDAERVPVAPGDRLDRILRVANVKPGPQDGAITDTRPGRPLERWDDGPGSLLAEVRIPARFDAPTGVEHIIAELDVLTRNIVLVLAAAVVTTDHAGIRRRALRPIDPLAREGDLLSRVIPSREPRDERCDMSALGVHDGDAGAVVLRPRGTDSLVRVRDEEPPPLEAVLERDIDGGTVRQEPFPARGGLRQRTPDQGSVLVEYLDVGRHRGQR